MKILHINTTDSGGGAALNTFRVCHEEIRQGQDSFILVGNKRTSSERSKQIKGYQKVKFIERWLTKTNLRDLFFVKNTDLFEMIEYKECDIVVLHNMHQGYFKVENIARICKEKPTVWIFHDMWPFIGVKGYSQDDNWWEDTQTHTPQPKNILDRLMFNRKKRIYKDCNFHIVTPSKWLYDLTKKSILKDFPISLINNGIDSSIVKPESREELRSKFGIPANKKVIAFLASGGVENLWKGGIYMQQIFEKISNDPDIMLLEMGGRGKTIVKNSNKWTIPYIRDRKELSQYLNLADIFLFTSIAENFPLVLLEAQSAGIPTVTFDVGGSKEIVKHGKTGYVAKYKDVDDAINGIQTILSDKELSNNYSKAARQNVLDNYTLQRQSSSYIKLYKEVIQKFRESNPTS